MNLTTDTITVRFKGADQRKNALTSYSFVNFYFSGSSLVSLQMQFAGQYNCFAEYGSDINYKHIAKSIYCAVASSALFDVFQLPGLKGTRGCLSCSCNALQ